MIVSVVVSGIVLGIVLGIVGYSPACESFSGPGDAPREVEEVGGRVRWGEWAGCLGFGTVAGTVDGPPAFRAAIIGLRSHCAAARQAVEREWAGSELRALL